MKILKIMKEVNINEDFSILKNLKSLTNIQKMVILIVMMRKTLIHVLADVVRILVNI